MYVFYIFPDEAAFPSPQNSPKAADDKDNSNPISLYEIADKKLSTICEYPC